MHEFPVRFGQVGRLFSILVMGCLSLRAAGQISLSTAVDLALKSSPKVKLAQADLAKARAAYSESKDAFVPAVSATGGVGKATGAPLSPPVVFSIAAQSLVFNSSQADYIHAARASIDSAQLALDATRSDVVEDVTSTYVTLDNALQRSAVQKDALGFAQQLVTIVQDRVSAGVDTHVELTKARRTATELRLQQLLIEDEISTQTEHLAQLTELPRRGLQTVHSSIPALQPPAPQGDAEEDAARHGVGLSAAFAAARAKQYMAHGDKRYLLRPQVAFSAEYSRISTAFNTYTQYYPSFGAAGNSFNSLSLGVGITLPILDMVHRAKARESAADAVHSLLEAQIQQTQFMEARSKLRHGALELAARRDLAQLDRDLAQDQLDAVLIRLQPTAGATQGEQLSPKDEQNARLQERQKTIDILNADLQLEQTEVSLMRQEGSLSGWLAATIPASVPSPPSAPTPPLPNTLGTEPTGAPPAGTAPSSVPTVGTPPSTLPSAPVTNPVPSNPPTAPSTSPSGPPHP